MAKYLSDETRIYMIMQRKLLGMTQNDLAELFNVTRTSIVSFENGYNERVDIFFKYVYNVIPSNEREKIISEYVGNTLK